MAVVDTGGLRKGLTIELDNELVRITEYQHIKQGRGSAFVRVTMRNLRTGSNIERTFQAGSKFNVARLERQTIQFLYKEGDDYFFMDTESYEQFSLGTQMLGDAVNYMTDGMMLDRTTHEGETIGVEVPITVDLRVVATDPGFAGDTQSGARKPATTETGLVLQVPLFVDAGDVIRVDTRTGEYQTRV